MLVLTRRVGEEVVLPEMRVRFTVLSIAGGRIRVGVSAPDAVTVLRGELTGTRHDAGSETLGEQPTHTADHRRSMRRDNRV